MLLIKSQRVELQESILAAVLVCDWNVRAWMFLESIKGRHNVRILCKNGTTLSVREIINRVYAEGRIEVCILCDLLSNFLPRWATTSRRHPWTTISARATSPTKSSAPSSVANQPVVQAMISSSGASSTPSSSGRAGSISGSARTSLSEARARCRENGLSWAPKTKSGKKQGPFNRVFDGIDTGACESRERKDFGQWFICELDGEEDPVTPNTLDFANEIWNIRRSFLFDVSLWRAAAVHGDEPAWMAQCLLSLAAINGASRSGVGKDVQVEMEGSL